MYTGHSILFFAGRIPPKAVIIIDPFSGLKAHFLHFPTRGRDYLFVKMKTKMNPGP